MKNLKSIISLDNPFRLLYHKLRAITANIIYWFPSKDMKIIWITGTNWKTTTSNIIAKWLKSAWYKVFMFTTVNIIIGDKEYINNTKMTSPDAFLLQKLLKQAKNEWCEIAVIETASHGIKMSRVWWIEYDFAVLTNITQDHLDLHRTMKDYVNTKLRLFKELITNKRKPWVKKTWIININSEYSDLFLAETYDSLYKYWLWWKAELTAINLDNNWLPSKFDIKIPWSLIKVETKLKWNFNIENILAAVWVFIGFWLSSEQISNAIKSIDWVPGRLEMVDNNIWADIFVDYAHTEDALEKVLTTLKWLNYNKVITIFWATWDRDKTKRPIMWQVVSRISDIVILTQDDDYTEDTNSIIKDVMVGIDRKKWEDYYVISSRKEAIELWISLLSKWDCLLVAGKWDEHKLITNNWPIDWHDKSIITDILKWIDDNKIIN